MKKLSIREVVLLVLPCLALAFIALLLQGKGVDDTERRLARYPHAHTFSFVVSQHLLVSDEGQAGAKDEILCADWFDPQNQSKFIGRVVFANGIVGGGTIYKNHIGQIFRSHLSQQQLVKLRASYAGLPNSTTSPPVARLLILSYRFKDEVPWQPRIYDRFDLPEEVKATLQIAGIKVTDQSK